VKRVIALVVSLVLLLGLVAIAGRPPIEEPFERYKPPKREYFLDGFPAVWLLVEERDVYNADGDGCIEFQIHQKMEILDDRGVQRYLDYEIGYDSMGDELTVQTASVTLSDGTILTPTGDAIVDVSVSSQRMYSSSRRRIIHWPNLEPGAVIEIFYTIKHKTTVPNEFQSTFRFQDWMPIEKARFSIELPPDMMMFVDWKAYQSNGIDELPVESWSEGDTYYWELEKSPGIEPEYGMPSLEAVAPSLLISSFTDWGEITDWWWPRVERMMSELRDDIVARAWEITRYASTGIEKAMLLYHWIEGYLDYVALEFGEGGHIPYHPNEVYDRGYGDCKDGATLLTAMMKAVGIEDAYVALINTGGGVSPDTPTLWFNHAVAVLNLDEPVNGSEWLVLDTTASTYAFGSTPIGDQNRWLLVMGPTAQVVQSALDPPEANLWMEQKDLYLHQDGVIEGQVAWTFTGAYAAYFRYLMSVMPQRQILGFFQSYIRYILPGSDLQLDEYGIPLIQIQDPYILHTMTQISLFDFVILPVEEYQIIFRFVGQCGDISGDMMVFSIPQTDPPKGFWANEWRYYGYIFSFPHVKMTVTNVFIPVDYEFLYVPENWGIEDYWGSYIIEYKTTKDLAVEFNRVIQQIIVEEARHSVMPRRMYADYIKAINDWALRIERPLVIQRVSEN